MSEYQKKKMRRHYNKAVKLASLAEVWAADGAWFSAADRLEEAATQMRKAAVAKNKMIENMVAGK